MLLNMSVINIYVSNNRIKYEITESGFTVSEFFQFPSRSYQLIKALSIMVSEQNENLMLQCDYLIVQTEYSAMGKIVLMLVCLYYITGSFSIQRCSS